jgi:hypothetical protein
MIWVNTAELNNHKINYVGARLTQSTQSALLAAETDEEKEDGQWV